MTTALTGFGVWRVVFVGLALLAYTLWAFVSMLGQGAPDALARPVEVTAITIDQCFFLLNSRYLIDSSVSIKADLENRYLPPGIAAVVVLQLMFTCLSPSHRILDTEPMPWHVRPWFLLGGLVFFLVVEAEKLAIRLKRGSPQSGAVPGSGTA